MRHKLLILGIVIILFSLAFLPSLNAEILSSKKREDIELINPILEIENKLNIGGEEEGFDVVQTRDGGFITTGYTNSYPSHKDNNDIWLLKTDSDGNEEWNKTYGDIYRDLGNSVQQTSDGGYIITGTTCIERTNPEGSYGDSIILLKTDSYGDKQWSKFLKIAYYGDHDTEFYGYSVKQTTDGGYIVAGHCRYMCIGDDYCYSFIVLIKTDSNGEIMWEKNFQVWDQNIVYEVLQTSDGGFVLVGHVWDFGIGELDVLLLKTDKNGKKIWQRTYECGPGGEYGRSVQQTNDGGFIITGVLTSADWGLLLIKTDKYGYVTWNKTYCEDGKSTIGDSIKVTENGDFIVAGYYWEGLYQKEILLVKFDKNGEKIWSKKGFGGHGRPEAHSVCVTSDGGYVATGYIDNFYPIQYDVDFDLFLLKLDISGNLNWMKKYGTTYVHDTTPPEKPTITGNSRIKLNGDYDFSFVSTDAESNYIYYFIEWGDGEEEDWIGPYNSGETVILNHAWIEPGSFIIRAQAKNSDEYKSDWTTFQIKVYKNRNNPLLENILRFLQRFYSS